MTLLTRPLSSDGDFDRPNSKEELEMPVPPKRWRTTAAGAEAVIRDRQLQTFDPQLHASAVRKKASRDELAAWRAHTAERDEMILRAVDSGLTDDEIEEISGIARSTIRRILARQS